MSLQKKYYRKGLVMDFSVAIPDVDRVVSYDEDGHEIISWVKTDYPSIVRSHGVVEDWSLNNLLAAGVNPDFGIHTGLNTRLEGVDTVNNAVSAINSLLDSESTKVE